MDAPTIAQLTTTAGIATITALVSEVIWRTLAAPDATIGRFGPIVAMGLGIVIALGAGFLLGQGRLDLAQSALNGVFGGLSAMGIHDLVTSKAGVA